MCNIKFKLLIFLGQGYILHKNVLYQDNESAIKMEKNGINSCTGNARHVSISYFFVKDLVDKEDFYSDSFLVLKIDH